MPFNSVHFDGTNDFLSRGGGLTGAADSKQITGSFWIKKLGSDGTLNNIVSGADGSFTRLGITKNTSNQIRLFAAHATLGDVLRIDSTADLIKVESGWVHVLFSIDLTDTGKRHLYIDDVSSIASVTTYVNENIDFTVGEFAIGRLAPGAFGSASLLNGDLAELWVQFGLYIDFSIEANRRKFISAGGYPVDLGADGSIPTGSAPILFFSGTTIDWHTNKGAGGGFTENGALTDGAHLPQEIIFSAVLESSSQFFALLEFFKYFAGAINVVSTKISSIDVVRKFASLMAVLSTKVGVVEINRDIDGTIPVLSGMSGFFVIPGVQDFIGALAAQSAGAGEISVDYTIDGKLNSFSALAGSLDKTLPVTGLLAAQSSMTAALLEEFGTITSFEVIKPKPAELQGVYG